MPYTAAQINTIYQRTLQRDATSAEQSSWAAVSASGTLTDAEIVSSIVGLPEAVNGVHAVIRIYQSAFGRVPDQGGLDAQTDGLVRGNLTIKQIAAGFVTSQEFANFYNAGTLVVDNAAAVTDAFLSALYLNVLGRAGSAAEIQAWKTVVATPNSGYARASDVLFGFSQSPEFTTKAASAVTTFLTAAANGTQTYTGPLISESSLSVGKTVTLSNNNDGPGAVSPAVDTNGTTGDDLYVGTFGSANGDFIDGKAGNDTLKLTGNGTAVVSVTSVENIEGLAAGGAAEFNLVGASGISKLSSVGSTSTLTFSGLSTLVGQVDVKNVATGGVTVTYNAGTVAGATDSQKVTLDGFGLSTAAAGDLILQGIETLDITAVGTNRFGFVQDANIKDVKVTGAGTFRTNDGNAFGATLKTFDASAATGAVRIGLSGGGDVSVKTGTANDRVSFHAAAGDLTTKDSVDLGAGTDTLSIVGADISAATGETLKALNASKGVEVLRFEGGSVTLDNKTLTNTEMTKFVFEGAGNDTVNNASASANYAFGTTNTGNVTFTMAAAATNLNLALEASAKTPTAAFDDADVGTVNTGAALTVNISSTGTTDDTFVLKDVVAGNAAFNDVGTVTATANATVNVTGDANTFFNGFANAVNLQAGGLKATLVATGSGADDIIVGGTVKNFLSGAAGIDNIDITKTSTVAGDIINLSGIVAGADRDVVSGFQAGASGDVVRVAVANTTAATAAGATIAVQDVNSNTGNIVFNTAANDVLELSFAIAGNTLAADATGAALLTAIGTLNVSADQNTGFIVAYQNGNAFLYHVAESNDGGVVVANADVALIATFNGVAVGAFDTSNFLLV